MKGIDMDIVNVIDKLDALVSTSSKVPGTHSRLVDAEKISELVEQLRLAIPQDMRAAQEVIEKKDSIINQAQVDARRTRVEAEEEFSSRLEQNELLIAARRQAQEMMEEAEQRAHKLTTQAERESTNNRAEADAYVTQSLRNLEREMTSVLTIVRKGLETLGASVRV
jgi:septum formation inhibitor MinC